MTLDDVIASNFEHDDEWCLGYQRMRSVKDTQNLFKTEGLSYDELVARDRITEEDLIWDQHYIENNENDPIPISAWPLNYMILT